MDKPIRGVSLLEHFSGLADPRVERTRLHLLSDILMIAVCGAICGAENWNDIEDFGQTKEDWLRGFLALPNGIPSHDTFNRVFARLDPVGFEGCFLAWMKAVSEVTEGQVIAIDGKTLRHSYDRQNGKGAIHMVNAWASQNRLVLAQTKVADKSNEITAIPALLHLLTLKGCIVTIDAMGCQTEIAQTIIDGGGEYVLAVKGNQGHLHEDIKDLFETEFAQPVPFEGIEHDYCRTTEKDHGRIEIRECWTIAEPDYLEHLRNCQAWAELRTVALVRCTRRINDQETVDSRYYISSLSGQAEPLLHACRSHWGVENSLHWVLDVAFREDDSRMRQGHSPHNFAIARQMALNLLRQETSCKRSIKGKRLKAGWDNNYLLKVITSMDH